MSQFGATSAPAKEPPKSSAAVLLVPLAVVIGVIVGTTLLLRWFVHRPRGDDVGDRPEFSAAQAQLAGLDACSISYGMSVRGSDAERRQYGYLYVKECEDGALAVSVPLAQQSWQRGVPVELRRGSRADRWGIYVNKGSVSLQATVNALNVFAPVLVASYPAHLAAQRAALRDVDRDRAQRENAQQTQQQQNAATWR